MRRWTGLEDFAIHCKAGTRRRYKKVRRRDVLRYNSELNFCLQGIHGWFCTN
jgi:hypothetical protein